MSDDVVVESNSAASSVADTASAGTLLRRAREAAGLHVAALAVSMKVPVKKLEALEADRLDLLPDAVFVRALASSVCRTLKIDAAPILQRLPQTTTPKLDAEERGINAPFHAAGDFKARTWPSFLSRPAVLWVAALLLGVVAVVFFPESHVGTVSSATQPVSPAKEATQEVPKDAVATATPVAVEAPAPIPAAVASSPTPVTAVPVVVAPQALPVASAAVTSPATTGSAPKVVVAAQSPVPSVVASAPVTSGIVTLRAKGESWVEVTDAKGTVQIRKVLTAGEVAYASGTLPLAVVIGRADVTQVEVRGQSFSLDAISKDNVARFEVK